MTKVTPKTVNGPALSALTRPETAATGWAENAYAWSAGEAPKAIAARSAAWCTGAAKTAALASVAGVAPGSAQAAIATATGKVTGSTWTGKVVVTTWPGLTPGAKAPSVEGIDITVTVTATRGAFGAWTITKVAA